MFLTEDMILIFPPTLLNTIVSSLLDITDADALKLLADKGQWLYWDEHGIALAEKVADLRQRFRQMVVQTHEGNVMP